MATKKLVIEIRTEKPSYQENESILLNVIFKNTSHKDITLESPLKEGVHLIYQVHNNDNVLQYISPVIKEERKQIDPSISLKKGKEYSIQHAMKNEEGTPLVLKKGTYTVFVTYFKNNPKKDTLKKIYMSKKIQFDIT